MFLIVCLRFVSLRRLQQYFAGHRLRSGRARRFQIDGQIAAFFDDADAGDVEARIPAISKCEQASRSMDLLEQEKDFISWECSECKPAKGAQIRLRSAE